MPSEKNSESRYAHLGCDGKTMAFEVAETQDSFSKAISKHEYPGRDGAYLEDMGSHARTVQLKGYYMGDRYELHHEVLAFLESTEVMELEHPKYGVLKGRVESITVRHDDRMRTAEMDINFVEQLILDAGDANEAAGVSAEPADPRGTGEQNTKDAVQEQKAEVKKDAWDAMGAEASAVVDAVVEEGKTIIECMEGLSRKARSYVKAVSEKVDDLEAALATVENPANSLIGTIEWSTDIAGRVTGAIARTCERYALAYESLKTAPEKFASTYRGAIAALEETLGLDEQSIPAPNGTGQGDARAAACLHMQKHLRVSAAVVGALHLAYVYQDDQEERRRLKKREGARAFDALGRYLDPPEEPEVLNITQIERSLAIARGMLADAIAVAPGMGTLRATALDLLNHVKKVKLKSEDIEEIRLAEPVPLLLLCHRRGQHYRAARRLLAINPEVQNANFVSGKVRVYAE